MTTPTTLPSYENALHSRRRRATLAAVSLGVLLAAWLFLLACQITDDVVDPVPRTALLMIGVVAVLVACALSAVFVIASRSARVREQHRIAAAIASEHLPEGIDVQVWEPTLRRRSNQNVRNRVLILAPLLGVFAAVQLSRTSSNIYGTLLWTSYLAIMLIVVLTSLTTFSRTRSSAQHLLVQLECDIGITEHE